MAELIPKAISFTLLTEMPAPAAARSLARTASICCPRLVRRRLATNRPTTLMMTRKKNPRTGLGIWLSMPRKPALLPRLSPKIIGEETALPVFDSPQIVLVNQNCSMATAAARLTTASCTPRTRSAEAPMNRPTSVAARTPSSGPSGKPRFQASPTWAMVNPATPASGSWTMEIWPT